MNSCNPLLISNLVIRFTLREKILRVRNIFLFITYLSFTILESREAAWIDPVIKSVHKIRSTKGVRQAPTPVGVSLS